MTKFLGFKQVTLAWFEANSATTDLKQYMWLVRDEENINTSIYFGSRKYAEINNDLTAKQTLETLSSLIASIGGSVNENGKYISFLPLTDSTILNSSSTIAEALQVLNDAIESNAEAIRELQNEMELTESALAKEIQERIKTDEEHERLISGLSETIRELISDNTHVITGDDIEI